MLLVIADTSPIRYLVQIGQIELLHVLFPSVSVPEEVELSDSSAPSSVQKWMKSPPNWLNIHEAPLLHDPALDVLDPGERAAISLGIFLNADLLLIDERKGSAVAARKGLNTTGTLGILDLARKKKLINLREAIELLKQTNFRYRQDLIENLLAKHDD